MLYKGSLPEIYNTILYTVHEKYVTNKYGHAKTESSQLSTKIIKEKKKMQSISLLD